MDVTIHCGFNTYVAEKLLRDLGAHTTRSLYSRVS